MAVPTVANLQYRGIEFIKDFTIKYINGFFLAQEKGRIVLEDGTRKITFSRRPEIVKHGKWDFRNVPAIIVGAATGTHRLLSVAKDFIGEELSSSATPQYRDIGGDIELSLNFSVKATSGEERDRLVDILGIALSHPDFKDWNEQHYIRVAGPPSINGESGPYEPATDFPIYETNMSMPIYGYWRDYTVLGIRVLDIIVNITLLEETVTGGREIL
jgi:hypothetical protein